MVLVALSLVASVLIIVGCVLWDGSSMAMGLLLGHMRLLVLVFWMTYSFFFGYPTDSGESLVAGTLRRRYYQVSFAAKKPTWGLPPVGRVAALVTARLAVLVLQMSRLLGLVLLLTFPGSFKLQVIGRGFDSPRKLQFSRFFGGEVSDSQSPGVGSVFLLMGIFLGMSMPRGGVLHRVWENASRFVRVEFNACRVKGSGVTCVDKHTSS